MSLSKNKIKYIQSLKEKKFRVEHGTFLAEGKKLVSELLQTTRCQLLTGLSEVLKDFDCSNAQLVVEATADELKKASHLKTTSSVIGVFYQPKYSLNETDFSKGIHLVLDGIQDPGNLGTIVRTSDWFGIRNIICSTDTVDIFNPKVVQSTMGAIARVKIFYTDLNVFFDKFHDVSVLGTFLEGENIYQMTLPEDAFIVMGNEGKGISSAIHKHITDKIFIPNFSSDQITSESLNVSAATAIVCSEFRRRGI